MSWVFFCQFPCCHLFGDWLSCFLAERWTKTFADCGVCLVCAFHLVHRAVFAYFCSALPPSLVCINLTAVWLSLHQLALLLCLWGVSLSVCVCVWLSFVEEEGLVYFSRDSAMQMNSKMHKVGLNLGYSSAKNHPKDSFLWIQNRIMCKTSTWAPELNNDIISNFFSPPSRNCSSLCRRLKINLQNIQKMRHPFFS